jgi:16S rRNA (cytosine1402-N4)-methyltransferase
MKHYSVLLNETIEQLNIKPDGIYVDGTLGRGGHSSLILSKLTTGHLYCFDLDEQAIEESGTKLLINELNRKLTKPMLKRASEVNKDENK